MSRAFTLLELLLVITIVVILVVLSIPFVSTFYHRSNFHTAVDEVIHALRLAQARAQAVEEDSTWSVSFRDSENRFVVFMGDDWDSRDSDYDVEYNYPDIITLTTDLSENQITFNKLYGTPSSEGTISIQSTTGESASVSINKVGKIER